MDFINISQQSLRSVGSLPVKQLRLCYSDVNRCPTEVAKFPAKFQFVNLLTFMVFFITVDRIFANHKAGFQDGIVAAVKQQQRQNGGGLRRRTQQGGDFALVGVMIAGALVVIAISIMMKELGGGDPMMIGQANEASGIDVEKLVRFHKWFCFDPTDYATMGSYRRLLPAPPTAPRVS